MTGFNSAVALVIWCLAVHGCWHVLWQPSRTLHVMSSVRHSLVLHWSLGKFRVATQPASLTVGHLTWQDEGLQ